MKHAKKPYARYVDLPGTADMFGGEHRAPKHRSRVNPPEMRATPHNVCIGTHCRGRLEKAAVHRNGCLTRHRSAAQPVQQARLIRENARADL